MRTGYFTETPVRTNVSVGDKIIVYKKGDKGPVVHDVRVVGYITATTVKEKGPGGRSFSRRTHKQIGGTMTFNVVSEEQAMAARKVLSDENEARIRADDVERQAAYDALPESVKLARRLRWLCDVTSETRVADMSIEALRGAVAFLEENGKDMYTC